MKKKITYIFIVFDKSDGASIVEVFDTLQKAENYVNTHIVDTLFVRPYRVD